jgi:uncharacterized protein
MIVDRSWMCEEPNRRCSMIHFWNDLLFLHWEVDIDQLSALIPSDLTIDTFEGKAYIGLVPFRISEIRANGFRPVPGFSTFPEINVRTYVLHKGKNPGVWFFSLDAANVFACFGARLNYKLPYFFAEMSQTENIRAGQIQTLYRSRRYFPGPLPAYASIDYIVQSCEARPSEPGTLAHFLVERYLLYAHTGHKLLVGQVNHTPYPIQQATVQMLEENLVSAAGILRPKSPPQILFARSVDVKVYPLISA